MKKITSKTALVILGILLLLAAGVILYVKYVSFIYCMTGLFALIVGVGTGWYAKTFYDRYLKK